MITSLQIQNFRGLKDVTLQELRRVNLLVGGNDTGKTSVLEALILLLGDSGAILALPTTFRTNQSGTRTSAQTVDDRESFWPWLFYDGNSLNPIRIFARIDYKQTVALNTEMLKDGNARRPAFARSVNNSGLGHLVQFGQSQVNVIGRPAPLGLTVLHLSARPSHPAEDAEKYNRIALEANGEEKFERIMREVEPRIKRLRYAKLPGTSLPLVYVDLGLSRAVPSTQMGQAFNRILHIYAEILTSKTNVLLIDEIENGIFSESLPLIWKGLLAVCEEQNVQIFATTHSRECVMAAHAAAEDRGKDELSVQRLQFVKGNVEAVRLGKQHLEVAAEMGLEVRS